MKIENVWTGNWENAFRGMRHPYESYKKSDSYPYMIPTPNGDIKTGFHIGDNDMDLAQRLIGGGEPNDKFLRQIFVSMDITAPLYWWKECDQYRISTTTNSQSTMHKLSTTPITIDCFETDDMDDNLMIDPDGGWYTEKDFYTDVIQSLEFLRLKYLETKDMRYWKALIRWLPESWLQTRTWTADYVTLRHIWKWRRNHKLTEWHTFCDAIEELPYAQELILYKNALGE